MPSYVPIDGRDHRWDDLGEAVVVLVQHYRDLVRRIFVKSDRTRDKWMR